MKKTLITAMAASALALAACHRTPAPESTGDPKVEGQTLTFPSNSPQLATLVVEPATESKPRPIRFLGRVVWDDDVTTRVYTPFSGRVTRILVDTSSRVETQGTLALIASPDFGQAQADAHRAVTDLALAERNLSRTRDLFEHGAAPQKDLFSAEADYARAQAERQRAEARLKLYGDFDSGIDQLFRLTSPVSGIVVERTLNPGQEVRPDSMLANNDKLASPLFVISDPSRVWVIVEVAEQDLFELQPGSKVAVRSRAFPEETFEGTVRLVADQINPGTRMIPVRLSVENPKRLLKAEMLVTVELGARTAAGLEVPSNAVFLKGDQHFVFCEQGAGRFDRRPVRVGSEQDGKILILAGLHAGERVVSDGCLLLEQILADD